MPKSPKGAAPRPLSFEGPAAMPARTRAAIQAECASRLAALSAVLGPERAAELFERAEAMPPPARQEAPRETPGQRALRLMETRAGRAELAKLTWETL